jgi:hypothetical protein
MKAGDKPAAHRFERVWRCLRAPAIALVAIAGCTPAPPPRAPAMAPESAASQAPGAARPLASVPVPLPSMALPEGPIYACDVGGARAPIELAANVEALCRRHPEMGPCKFERDACRKRGGRVYTAKGEEVTVAVEAEYDRRVMRVRLQADGAPSKK